MAEQRRCAAEHLRVGVWPARPNLPPAFHVHVWGERLDGSMFELLIAIRLRQRTAQCMTHAHLYSPWDWSNGQKVFYFPPEVPNGDVCGLLFICTRQRPAEWPVLQTTEQTKQTPLSNYVSSTSNAATPRERRTNVQAGLQLFYHLCLEHGQLMNMQALLSSTLSTSKD